MIRNRTFLAIAALAATIPATASAATNGVFDFANMAAANGAHGNSFDFVLAGFGTIRATALAGYQVTTKGKNDAPTGTLSEEKGAGLCKEFGNPIQCPLSLSGSGGGDEIGDFDLTGWLQLEFIFDPGVSATALYLTSVQEGEKFDIDLWNGSAFADWNSGTGPNLPNGAWGITGLSFGNGTKFKFNPVLADYLVAQVNVTKEDPDTPHEVVPEPASMALMTIGLVGLAGAGYIRRRRRSA